VRGLFDAEAEDPRAMDSDRRLVVRARGSAGAVIASAVPRISSKCTRHGSANPMSSTTSAAWPLRRTLQNFWLAAMLKQVTSIVPRARGCSGSQPP
jgi:hypothetical protein